jgi:hypothetical protein
MPYVARDENVWESLTGQSNDYATPDFITTNPDEENKAAIAAANDQYMKDVAKFQEDAKFLADEMGREFHEHFMSDRFVQLKNQLEMMGRPENQPQKPDPIAIEAQSNRSRLFKQAAQQYQPAISDLMAASRGEGPSAALNYYREAADDAARRNYGMAASARGTGGQRAALFQAALGQEAMDRQKAAMKAAQVGAEEQNAARAQLGQLLNSQTDVYRYLAGDTSHVRDVNQNAAAQNTAINAGIGKENDENKTEAYKGAAETAGDTALAVGSGGSSIPASAARRASE